jgi:adenylate cyclase
LRKTVAGALIGLAAGLIILALDQLLTRLSGGDGFHPLQTAELKTYDWRLARTADPRSARQDIALIEINEYSLRNLEPLAGRWPWPRAFHAFLLDYLARGAPKLVVYDVNFAEADRQAAFNIGNTSWTGADSDLALANAVTRAGNVILLVDATFEGEALGAAPSVPASGFSLNSPLVEERNVLFPPFKTLADATTSFGHNLFVLDRDGPLRFSVPFVRQGAHAVPSLGLAAAIRAEGIPASAVRIESEVLHIGDRRLPLSRRTVRSADGERTYYRHPINFRGPALLEDLKTRPYPNYAFFDLLLSEQQIAENRTPDVDPAVFKDKIVFVGATASGLKDVFETPFAGGAMPGIQVHAAAADDVLSNRFIRSAGGAVHVTTVVAAGLAVGVAAATLPAWWATIATLAAAAVFAWVTTRLFAGGYWLNLSQPMLVGALSLFGGVAYQYFIEGREKRKMRRLFGQYVSKDVCEQLVENPSLARLGGQRREMTVLFSDIRGFTTVTEQGNAEDVVGMLNEYFTRMVEIVFTHRGTLDKFVGDMVMALFNAPLDDPAHADHAVEAALDMIQELEALNRKWAAEGRFAGLDIGIGINTGPMIAGNIGSEAIMSYTVIGDAVNLGARLESLNKQYGTRIIISDATRQRLTGRYSLKALGDVVVKGKSEPVAIFEVARRPDLQSNS